MRCQEIRSLMKSYFSGETDEYTKIKIHHHLAKCTACSEQYDMWSRGEEAMKLSLALPRFDEPRRSNKLSSSVMDRIKSEEKWANPNLAHSTTTARSGKKVTLLVSLSLIIVFFIIISTTFFPQKEVYTDFLTTYSSSEAEQVNRIILSQTAADTTSSLDSGTEISFTFVASINEPFIFSLPEEEKERSVPVMILVGVFSLFCIILGLSWLTRV